MNKQWHLQQDGTGPTKHYRVRNLHGQGVADTEENIRLMASAPELLAALQAMQAAITEYNLRDVNKRFSLCVADAAASTAIAKATGKNSIMDLTVRMNHAKPNVELSGREKKL